MIKAIIAYDEKGGAGLKGSLPWPRNNADMKRFAQLTKGCVVVMGSGTWNSDMPSPLTGRINVVVSTRPCKGAHLVIDKDKIPGLPAVYGKDVWIIGGPKLLSSTIDIIDEIYVTEIPGEYKCDVFYDLKKISEHFEFTCMELSDEAIFKIGVRRHG